MEQITPIYRIEHFLDAIVNGSVCPFDPLYRVEYYLAKLAGADIVIPEPMYRIEFYLAKLCGEDVAIPEPMYRVEFYLAAACGEEVTLPEPMYRIEYWLNQMASNLDWATFTGNIIQFNTKKAHAVQSCVAEIEPVQDLNGYDAPWVGGAGKNLFDGSALTPINSDVTVSFASETISLTNDNGYGVNVFHDSNGDMIYAVQDGSYVISIAESTTRSIAIYASTDGVNFSWLANGITTGNTTATFTISGQTHIKPVCYVNANSSITIKKFQLEEGSTATAYAPYSNICPISGHTEAKVTRTGKNLFSATPTLYSTVYVEFFGNHSASSASSGIFLKAGTYTLSIANPNGAKLGVYGCYLDDKTQITIISNTSTETLRTGTITLTKDRVLNFWIYFSNSSAYVTNLTAQLELGSTATDYEPYNGNTYTIDLDGTRYGGTVDLVTGVLTVNRKGIDMGSLPWTYQASTGSFMVYGSQIVPNRTNGGNLLCSIYPINSASSSSAQEILNAEDKKIYWQSSNAYLYIKDSTYGTDKDAFITAVTGQTLVYELATPITIQLTAQQVEALKGQNTMWADTGDITVVARGEAIQLNGLQLMRTLLGSSYVNNNTEEDISDEEAASILLGGTES